MAGDEPSVQFTRPVDLMGVAVLSGLAAYLLVRWNYGALPVLPRLAGVSAAVLGIGEALAGLNIRARLNAYRHSGRPGALRPLPPLVAARALMVAKASSLAGAGLAGVWAGLLIYVAPRADSLRAAAGDSATGWVGLVSALILVGGALWLERSCRAPHDGGPGDPPGGRAA